MTVPKSLRRPLPRGFCLVTLVGVLVVPGVLGLFRDLVDDVLRVEAGLAAEPRDRLYVVGAVEIVRLAVLHVAQGREAFLHPAMTRRAGADAAARRAVMRAQLQRRLEQRGP